MPSDSKKREQARKKEAQKTRGKKIATVTSANGTNGVTTNGTNGAPVELTEEGMYTEFNSTQLESIICSSVSCLFGFFYVW